jgi:hypothetical protein
MPRFTRLSREDVGNIYQYIRAKAREVANGGKSSGAGAVSPSLRR